MLELSFDVQKSYMSEYLESTWKLEKMAFRSVSVERGTIVGLLDVKEYAIDDDGEFHLSAQAAMAWMSQLAIIYGCWDNNLPKKVGEVYLRKMQLDFYRPVRKTCAIHISGSVPPNGRRVLPDESVYYRDVKFSIEQGAFSGTASFIVPTVKRASTDSPKISTHQTEFAV